jgi:hypothetical protein
VAAFAEAAWARLHVQRRCGEGGRSGGGRRRRSRCRRGEQVGRARWCSRLVSRATRRASGTSRPLLAMFPAVYLAHTNAQPHGIAAVECAESHRTSASMQAGVQASRPSVSARGSPLQARPSLDGEGGLRELRRRQG